uniref:Small ribosomal subunit protein uS11c n=1 Tax=Cuscuta erosa TaxID=437626 RepID=A0A4Y5N1N2_9ASTE|nr:ribosomal protein S11 [Cuscuta erosa]QCW07694.1 ribosomal protein S11 [Cuscuta erosa]
MAKLIPRISSRKNGHIRLHKNTHRITHGIIHIQASLQNTIVTVTDIKGRVISWASAGSAGFKGTTKKTPFAAQTAVKNAIRTAVNQGMHKADVLIKGPGLGRDAALRAIRLSRIRLELIMDITPIPHNGCRPPKKRRV